MPDSKPKLGWFELTGCAGCGLSVLNMEDDLLDLLDNVDLREFQMATSLRKAHEDGVDVAFVEGSVCTEDNLEELKEVREMSDILVAIGTCATWGGVQGLGNDMSREELFEGVYDLDADTDRPDFFQSKKPAPHRKYVEVDYELPGCPPNKEDIKQLLMDLARDVIPVEENRTVCRDCKLNGYECVLAKRDLPCLGPITVAGCDAPCLRDHIPCFGCRGPVPDEEVIDDNARRERELLKEKGYDDEFIESRMREFAAYYYEEGGVEDMKQRPMASDDNVEEE